MFTNRYIFTYATIMIIIVASILATAANILKPFQDNNVKVEKIKNILSVADVLDADKSYTAEEYDQIYLETITDEFVVNTKGEINKEEKAFNINLAEEQRKAIGEQKLPVFIASMPDGSKKYIIPVRGKGLWGPVWGFLSVSGDGRTVLGANFGHKGETPGLGAEIDKPKFGNQFIDKQIFDDEGKFTSIKVVKGGALPGDKHGVDAISGGTITCVGVSDMLFDCLSGYEAYFKNLEN
ncbi:MAG: NADH:ubiquinone reductase (Na(+)-transporting) subunit C [Bacteroidetes bacterium]|nr:NADH:ubiquinone reductase (Na(+)-transporting) subunit C [Bacteroidota bacterium]MBT5530763.1 NADH:ubiquinone reductase (Na(+)-transporting) subunit C [Cytophagia bacterium]MBT3421540.1 NADH:ubiquinone reductase (Na(+)-transporting) subunit C [Bacteroidota bacterium]MBT3935003.1 NADH:ubiquinone reductase (Na(+)-transporting) subunit C [Bacteroidota bacterium]MBT4340315.1 NADH:ubiquinone reductase (Na(+)-transporting) subunit C [Bacteroidota bacterium]